MKRFMIISMHEDVQRYDNLKITEPLSSRIDGIVQILEHLIKCSDDFFQAFPRFLLPLRWRFPWMQQLLRRFRE